MATGLALLVVGLPVALLVGAWAGVATAAVTGILFPVVHTARATYSEPLAILTLTAGLLALTSPWYRRVTESSMSRNGPRWGSRPPSGLDAVVRRSACAGRGWVGAAVAALVTALLVVPALLTT